MPAGAGIQSWSVKGSGFHSYHFFFSFPQLDANSVAMQSKRQIRQLHSLFYPRALYGGRVAAYLENTVSLVDILKWFVFTS